MTPDSRLDEYHAEAEALSQRLEDAVPADLVAGPSIVDSAVRSDVSPGPADPAWWQVWRIMDLVEEQDASARAAEAVSDVLTDEGWAYSRVRETDGGTRFAEGFRRDGWYVEVTWVASIEGKAEPLEITVASPVTTYGTG